jgi:hypothetical protein
MARPKISQTQAQAAATRALELAREIKKLTEQKAAEEATVREWCAAQKVPPNRLGDVQIYERKSPPKLLIPTSVVVADFQDALPYNYKDFKINNSKIFTHQESDKELAAVLKRFGIEAVQESELYLKAL